MIGKIENIARKIASRVRRIKIKPQGEKKFLGLIARCKDEYFVKEFCDYYVNEGVDYIYIIDDDSEDKSVYEALDDRHVEVLFSRNIIKNGVANALYRKVRKNFEWMIYVDIDEFITTRKNGNKTIRDELLTSFKNSDCIKVPWVMMSCNGLENSPKSVLMENVYRWNHDNRHPYHVFKFRCRYEEIEVKCIFKAEAFLDISDHHPIKPSKRNPIVVNSIDGAIEILDPIYENLREADIEGGMLLCYHYRIISIENCRRKLETNSWYVDKYTLEDLLSSDYAELRDETLRRKVARTAT